MIAGLYGTITPSQYIGNHVFLTHKRDELSGLAGIFGSDLQLWRTVVLELCVPYYLVRFSTREGQAWLTQTSLLSSENEVAAACAKAAEDEDQRIDDITILWPPRNHTSWKLTRIAEVWKGIEPRVGQTIVLLGEDTRRIGTKGRPPATAELKERLFPR